MAEDMGAVGYFETSAKTSENVDDVFGLLTKEMMLRGLNIHVDESQFHQ